MIAKWIASECKASFFNVRASTLFSKYLGESEKLVRAIFEEAEENAPSVIFLDEVDGILSARQGNDHESTRRVKNELLISMDGVTTSTRHQVTVIAASNMPWEIDEAALRRFEHKLYVPLPDARTRLALIKGELQRFAEECGKPACLHSDSIENVVQSTSGYSCSDIHQVLRMAALVPTREAISAGSPEFLRGLDTSDIEFALSRSTAKLVDTDKYSKWQSSFKN
jgi:SpoVK/Ycf46/Vps4 family AAA+-type ATPase